MLTYLANYDGNRQIKIKLNGRPPIAIRTRLYTVLPLPNQDDVRQFHCGRCFLFNTWSPLRILLRGYLLLSMRYCHDLDSVLWRTRRLLRRRHISFILLLGRVVVLLPFRWLLLRCCLTNPASSKHTTRSALSLWSVTLCHPHSPLWRYKYFH